MKIVFLYLLFAAFLGVAAVVTVPCQGNENIIRLLGRMGFMNVRYGDSHAGQPQRFARLRVSP